MAILRYIIKFFYLCANHCNMAILMNSFKFTMEILCLKGTDKRMYELVAPLIMNPAIIRQNNNYPFKTTDHYLWYIAKEWVEEE